ncbi:MAG: copper chaperone PCu(A)C, partial [Betaproteobacteria bacterium]
LKPGGHHMMLVDLKRPLKKGDLVPIRLKVELSDKTIKTIRVLAEVRDLAATGRP